jgi:hypothetical protein
MVIREMNRDRSFLFFTIDYLSERRFVTFLLYDPVYQIQDFFSAPTQVFPFKKHDPCRVSILDSPAGWAYVSTSGRDIFVSLCLGPEPMSTLIDSRAFGTYHAIRIFPAFIVRIVDSLLNQFVLSGRFHRVFPTPPF